MSAEREADAQCKSAHRAEIAKANASKRAAEQAELEHFEKAIGRRAPKVCR